jgi:hypothetical protein
MFLFLIALVIDDLQSVHRQIEILSEAMDQVWARANADGRNYLRRHEQAEVDLLQNEIMRVHSELFTN